MNVGFNENPYIYKQKNQNQKHTRDRFLAASWLHTGKLIFDLINRLIQV